MEKEKVTAGRETELPRKETVGNHRVMVVT